MLRIFKHDGTMEKVVYLGVWDGGGVKYRYFKEGERDWRYDYRLPHLKKYDGINCAKVVYV